MGFRWIWAGRQLTAPEVGDTPGFAARWVKTGEEDGGAQAL